MDTLEEQLKKLQAGLTEQQAQRQPLEQSYYGALADLAAKKETAQPGWQTALTSALPALIAGAFGGKRAMYEGASLASPTAERQIKLEDKQLDQERDSLKTQAQTEGVQLSRADKQIDQMQQNLNKLQGLKTQDDLATNRLRTQDSLARGRALDTFNREQEATKAERERVMSNPLRQQYAVYDIAKNRQVYHGDKRPLSEIVNDPEVIKQAAGFSPEVQSLAKDIDTERRNTEKIQISQDYAAFPQIMPITSGKVDPKLASAAAERENLYTQFRDKANDLKASLASGDLVSQSQDANDMVLFMANFLKRGANFTESEQIKIAGLIGIPVKDLFTPTGVATKAVREWASNTATPEVIDRLITKFTRDAATELGSQYKHVPTDKSVYAKDLWGTGRFDRFGITNPFSEGSAEQSELDIDSLLDEIEGS